jgi:hypothetical protein
VLQPIVSDSEGVAAKLKDYNVNNVVIQPGITVGEYEAKIMSSIYGTGVEAKPVLATGQ